MQNFEVKKMADLQIVEASSSEEDDAVDLGKTANPKLFTDIKMIDAQDVARQNPDTFFAPTIEELAAIKIGDVVKICDGKERFWTIVKEHDIESGKIVGEVDNNLISEQEYNNGDLLQFHTCNVYNIQTMEECGEMGRQLAEYVESLADDEPDVMGKIAEFIKNRFQ